MTEILDDNELIEGEYVKELRGLAKSRNWDGFNKYVVKLKNEGHSPTRINSMMTRAMHGIRL